MMILKFFIPGNLISLCMTIINSVIMARFYYEFLITLFIGLSYIFLLRAEQSQITKTFFDHRRPTRNSMCNLSIQCVFLKNLIS
uniref:Uncharacterized protein n=1 Tax=Gossypium raimondii TaxID=29730 RepID=A0A0D2SGA6_GOSRA|nr:hypothetical protein B456_009G405100 [Gossypium raimondii]